MTQYIKTVLEVDATKSAAGFKQGADASNRYERALGEAGRQADKTGEQLTGLSGQMRKNRAEWDEIGNTALVAGGAIAAGLGLAAKEAIDWESAWAGVQKTVNGSTAEMAALEEGLRDLTGELPATHEEIAGVAEAAGQLGIARGDLIDFTETAIALGETTNLSAEEAATGLAKISNVMGTQAEYGIEGIERMGSTLVALGNDGASTEADILAMAQRLAGAGETAGATEADVLALANALSSVGIEAQLGGGAMSRAILQMNSAVISGGEELEAFARISGMTSEEFAAKWRADPVAAVGEFVAGLSRISEQGGDAAGALDEVGLSGTENAQVFLRAAGASDLLTESLELGSEAWQANAALQEEAAKRYETDAARIQVSMNRVKDASIDFGASAAPVLADAAEDVADLADAYGDLPEPVQTFTTGLAAVTGGTLLLGGAAIKAVGFAQDLTDAFGKVGPAGDAAAGGVSRANRAARGLVKWSGYALGVVAVTTALDTMADAGGPGAASIEEVEAALLQLDRTASGVSGTAGIDQIFRDLGDDNFVSWATKAKVQVDGLGEAYERLTDPGLTGRAQDFTDQLRVWGETDTEQLEAGFEDVGEALAAMPTEEAARKFDLMVEELGGGEETAQRLLELMPAYSDKLTGLANDSKTAADGSEELNDGLSQQEQAAADAEAAISGLRDELEQMGGGFRAERAAIRSYEEALQQAKDVAKDSESTWLDQEEALDGIAQAAIDVATQQLDMGRASGVVAHDIAQARQDFIDTATAYGMTEEAAKDLADAQGLIPSRIVTEFEAAGAGRATAEVMELDDQIELLNGKTVTVEEAGALAAKGRVKGLTYTIDDLDGKKVKVTEIGSTAAGNRVVLLDGKIRVLSGKTVTVDANVTGLGSLDALEAKISRLSGRRVEVAVGTYKAGAMWAGGINYRDDRPHPMAGGGLIGGGKQIAPGALSTGLYATSDAGIWMAEDPTVPYEAYITPREDVRAQNVATLATVADDFGYALTKMRSGGLTGSEHFSRHYTPTMPAVTVQAPAAIGPSHETTAIIENLHGVTPEVAVRWAERKQREANLSRRNTG